MGSQALVIALPYDIGKSWSITLIAFFPGRSRTQATAWLQAAAWLRMGPMAPGALDHGPYGPQGLWAQPLFEPVAELFRFFQDFGRPNNNKRDIS